MSIQDAATRTVAQIQEELNAAAEALLANMGEAKSQVEETMSSLDSEWDELSNRGEELLTRVDEAQDQLQQLGDDLTSRADDVQQAVDGAMDRGRAAADSTRTVVETLGQGVAALVPDIDAAAASVEEIFSGFDDQARSLDSALDATRAAADEHIKDPFTSLVDNVKGELFERGNQLGQYVDGDFTSTLNDEVSKLTTHVDDLVSQGKDKVEEARATAEQEGSKVLEQVNSMFGDQFGELIGTVETVQSVMQQVGDVISGTADAVGTTTQVMSAGTSMTAIGAKSVIGIIEDVIEIFNEIT